MPCWRSCLCVLNSLLLAVIALAPGSASADDLGAILTNPDQYDCDQIGYGIYWYGPGNQAQKAELGVANGFWDPAKPTMIYTPGWQPDVFEKREHEGLTFWNPDTQQTINLADAWLKAGWNVGVFYWAGLADEADPRDVEAKIWSANGDPRMRWRRCSGDYSDEGSPTVGVGELFYKSYVEAMQGYQGHDIRIVGHSIGSQLAIRTTHMIADGVEAGILPANLLPTRVAQLDPWWTAAMFTKTWPTAAPQVTAMTQRLLGLGVLFEMYKSSDLLSIFVGDANDELTNLIGQNRLEPDFIPNPFGINITKRHAVAPKLYFLSFDAPPPKACADGCSDQAMSAALPNTKLKALLKQPRRWLQACGTMTASSADDCFVPQD